MCVRARSLSLPLTHSLSLSLSHSLSLSFPLSLLLSLSLWRAHTGSVYKWLQDAARVVVVDDDVALPAFRMRVPNLIALLPHEQAGLLRSLLSFIFMVVELCFEIH